MRNYWAWLKILASDKQNTPAYFAKVPVAEKISFIRLIPRHVCRFEIWERESTI